MPESRSCTPLVAAPCTSCRPDGPASASPQCRGSPVRALPPLARVRPCPGPPLPPAVSPGSAVFIALIACHSVAVPTASHCPCPGPACCVHPSLFPLAVTPALPLYHFLTTDMVRTRGGSRLRPRVRFSTPEQAEQAPASAAVPEPVPEEPQGFRRYQTRMGPRAPSPVTQRRSRKARPSKRARTSGPGESSSSRPQPSPSTPAAEETSSPQLSLASRVRRPLFVGTPIPGNVGLHARDFHGESFYDVPALTADPHFRDSMRLITHYSLLPFMTPRQFYYPRVVL